MFDPLSPPWPSTPHQPNEPIPHLRPVPSPPAKPDNPYGKEPQIYGKPEPGIVSPLTAQFDPYLRVRITSLDRNRRDILIKFDAQTTLANYTGAAYRNVSRSFVEFQQLHDAIVHNNPQTIVPALPLPQTSALTDEEDDRLVRIMFQRWMTRICEDVILHQDEDLRAFIESDFGYQPTPRTRKKSTSTFSLIRRGVPDEDEELQRARFELTKLETQFFDTAKAIDKLASARRTLATAHNEMGNKLINVATSEVHPPLANALRKIGRAWHTLADLDQSRAVGECVIIGDSFGYQGLNARSAKETLQQRTGVLEEYQAAVKTTISKRRYIERLKASSNIRPDRVDEALEEMEEANKYEQVLARRAEGISQNLHLALQTHNLHANEDVTTALIEHARSSIMHERQLLRELEALCPDVANSANKVLPTSNGMPRPTVVPPLEDYSSLPPIQRPLAKSQHASRPPPLHQPFAATAAAAAAVPSSVNRDPLSAPAIPNPPRQPMHSPSSSRPFTSILPASSSTSTGQEDPLSASSVDSFPRPTQLPRPSTPPGSHTLPPTPPPSDGPPLGGRYMDGTKSMIIPSSSSSSSSSALGPRRGFTAASNTLGRTSTSPLMPASTKGRQDDVFDPLGRIKPTMMTSSVRVHPTRPRLDAREAASKLATMF